ncbi:MAG: sulfite exporter TauE/SafE family protein [Gammaproteobacteria bacterium]
MSPDLLLFAALAIAAGIVVGLFAGLLGIGGGLILVPVLFELMTALEAEPGTAMRAAIATSLVSIIATGLRSALSHYRHGALDGELIRAWAPSMIGGSLLGAELATRVDASFLLQAFAVMTVVLAVHMAFGRREWRLGDAPPAAVWRFCGGGFVGFVAGLLGLGVAGIGVPLMTLFNATVRAAVPAVALIGALAATIAAARFVIAGVGAPGLPPFSFGYVNVLGCALILPIAMLTTPIGAAWSHRVSQRVLRRIFAAFLALNAVRMLIF